MLFLIGFPKSGTSSFQKLFTKIGLKSIHLHCKEGFIGTIIKKNKEKNVPLLTGLEKYDCITQFDICISETDCYWPQLVDYEQLYYENKDSIIILNKRCPKKILISFKNWNKLNERLYKYNPELINDKTDQGFINFIEKHYNDVENFFNSKPESKFLVYDIENDNINKLSKYIDIKNIEIFPQENIRII